MTLRPSFTGSTQGKRDSFLDTTLRDFVLRTDTMADIRGKKILVIGGAGFIGSHVVDELLKEDVEQVIIYDNFARGVRSNLDDALTDSRVRIFEVGGDILHTDVLAAAVGESDQVIHLAALWLLQCYEYPRVAFDVNVRGTFNVLEACQQKGIER